MWNPTICCVEDVETYNILCWRCGTLQYVVLKMWNPTICCVEDVEPYNMLCWRCGTLQYVVLKMWNPTLYCVEDVEPYNILCWRCGTLGGSDHNKRETKNTQPTVLTDIPHKFSFILTKLGKTILCLAFRKISCGTRWQSSTIHSLKRNGMNTSR